jgi:Leucine-rich repeat (LRR) protein
MKRVERANQSLDYLTLQMGTISNQISQGVWSRQEDQVAEKVLHLFRSKIPFFYNDREQLQDRVFTASLLHLIDALNGIKCKSRKMQETIQKLGYILQPDLSSEEWSAPGSMRDLKSLPVNTRNDIKSSLEEFRRLIAEGVPTATPALASWIQYAGISLSKLNLSKEELDALAPHLKYLAIDTNSLTEKEIHDLLSKCFNLESLVLATDNISTLSSLPSGLTSLNCSLCPNLKEITQFNHKLIEFYCTSCKALCVLPERTPDSLTVFESGDCPLLEHYPILNEGLKRFDISGNTTSELPALPSSLESLIMHDCLAITQLPEPLPEKLTQLDIKRSGVSSLPIPLPSALQQLEISWCVNLKLPQDLFQQLVHQNVELVL